MKSVTKIAILFILLNSLVACTTTAVLPPPQNRQNACSMFNQYPAWRDAAFKTEEKWHVPVDVQMAIVNRESYFIADARPPRTKWFWFIPGKPISTAYGYSQALNGTWKDYLYTTGQFQAKREEFKDGVDFIGWYSEQAHNKLHIPLNDPYNLYLAYHEGLGGYSRKSFLNKPWLMRVADRVKTLSAMYQQQLKGCGTAVA